MKVTEQQITEAIRNVYYINLDTAVMGQNIAEQEDLVDPEPYYPVCYRNAERLRCHW